MDCYISYFTISFPGIIFLYGNEADTFTCQSTVYHVTFSSKEPCALIVEKSVCPALFLTGGRGSTHSSPSFEYRHIHCRSGGGTGLSYLVPALPPSLLPSLEAASACSRPVRIFSRCWDRKSEIFH